MKFFKIDIDSNRIYGLDILRALAILFVFLAHGGNLLPTKIAAFQRHFLFDGVSMFFVLSGFLIGGILIKILEKENITLKTLVSFWKRRWLRTLPAYFFVLTLLVVLKKLFANDFKLWEVPGYLLFLQNFNQPHPNFFGEAWSLSVEEWFYFLIPLMIFLLIKLFRLSVPRAIITAAFSIILFTISFRLFRYSTIPISSTEEYDLIFRKQVITRLDSLMFGVLGAYVFHYYKLFWIDKKIIFFVAGIIVLLSQKVIGIWHLFGSEAGLYKCVFSFALTGIGTMFLLPFLSELKTGKGLVYKAFTYVSLISYSIYLLHLSFVQGILMRMDIDRLPNYNVALLLRYMLYWVLTVPSAIILYKYVEKSFIDLRDKTKRELPSTAHERYDVVKLEN